MDNFIIYIVNRLKKIISIWLLCPAFFKLMQIWWLKKGSKKRKLILALVQHLGDNVACEPIERYLRNEEPDTFIIRIIGRPSVEILNCNPNNNAVIAVSSLSEWIYLKWLLKWFFRIIDLHLDKGFCTKYRLSIRNKNLNGITFENYFNSGSLLEAFSIGAGLPKINEKPVYYLPSTPSIKFDLPECYIVIHTTSNAEQKSWDRAKWQLLVNYLIEEKCIAVVEIGFTNTIESNSAIFYDLCGKLNLNDIAFLIKRSVLFIGIDSSFGHFANALNTDKLILLAYWHSFRSYNPYSGMTSSDIDRELMHYDGVLSELPLETVINRLESKFFSDRSKYISTKSM